MDIQGAKLTLQTFLIFFVALPFLAAAFPVIDTINKEKISFGIACRLKEFWVLWLFYFLAAVACVFGLQGAHVLEFGTGGFISVLLGFPMLLQSKLFSLRTSASTAPTAFGLEYVLTAINELALRGMRESVNELTAELLGRWLGLDPEKLGTSAGNYLSTRATPEEKDKLLRWVTDTVKDAISSNDPTVRPNSLRTLFHEIRKAGGLRGVLYVIKQTKKIS